MRYLLATIGFIVLMVIAITIFARPQSKKATTNNKVIQLSSYVKNNNAQVRYTIEGPINAPEDHRSVQISVSPLSRTLNIISGYQGQVISSQTYANDAQSYSDFLQALSQEQFTAERQVSSNIKSQSICPLGNRTHFQILENAKDVMNLWTGSCMRGSFGGNVANIRSLFKLQIPDYVKLTNSVSVTGSVPNTGIF